MSDDTTTHLATDMQTKPVADFALHIPTEYVNDRRRELLPRLLFAYMVALPLLITLGYFLLHRWGIVFSVLDLSPVFFMIALDLLLTTAWISGPCKHWEWHFTERGLSLKNLKNPINAYNMIYVSPKRDTILLVEPAEWREYPALKVCWRHGSRKAQTALLVYRPEDSAAALDRIAPQLRAWQQNETVDVPCT